MIIPLWVHEEKDKQLINFLNGQTNRSATIRLILYQYINGIKFDNKSEPQEEIDDTFLGSLQEFN